MERTFFPVTLCAVAGCGLMAGLFFAFSVSVMRALGQLPPEKGIAAMQSINVTILNPVFFLVFFGAAIACIWALFLSVSNWHAPCARYLFIGSLLYLTGGLLVTMVFNVPMNDALASAHANSPDASRLWTSYLANWTAWNHVRTIASLAATIFFAVALSSGTTITSNVP